MSALSKVRARLAKDGLLLKQDKDYPCVVTLVTGERLSASWWAHPRAHEIFTILEKLADSKDVLVVKLVRSRDTLVHRKLWPQLLALVSELAPWQTAGLTPEARRLLTDVANGGEASASGLAARELILRMAVAHHEIHTASGAHAMVLESWGRWAKRVGCQPEGSAREGREAVEHAAAGLGIDRRHLPWNARRGGRAANARPRTGPRRASA